MGFLILLVFFFNHCILFQSSWKGYFVRAENLKFAGTFSVSVSFESPPVEGPEVFVCSEEECAQKMQQSCKKVHPCGHPCCGLSSLFFFILLFVFIVLFIFFVLFSSLFLLIICSLGIADENVCIPCLEDNCPMYGVLLGGFSLSLSLS